MRGSSVDVVVLLLTLNQREKTLRCLDSLRQVEAPRHRVWLWDNGSIDGTLEAVAEAFPGVRAHHHPENLGVACGRNAVARLAIEEDAPPFLLFLDNDMTVEPGFLEALLAPFAGDPHLAQTTGKIRDLGNPQRLYGAGGCRVRFLWGDTNHIGWGEVDRGQYDASVPCLPSGGCMLVRTSVFEELGGFDAVFNPYGPEDLDLGLRARRAGYRALYVPEAVVFHETLPGRTFEGGQYSRKYASNRARQWLRFLHRHGSLVGKLGFYLMGGPYLFLKVVVREGRRGNLVGAVRGLLSGLLASFKR